MKGTIPVFTLTLVEVSASILQAQQQHLPPFSDQFLELKQCSDSENEAIVKQFDGLRTTEVADALQMVALRKVIVMERHVGPIWINNETGRGPQ
jgi:hypothetical protein